MFSMPISQYQKIVFIKKNQNMKKAKVIFSLFLCVFFFNATVKAITPPSIVGKWYGLKDGSPITLVFRNDQTVTIHADAFSSLSFTCQYKIDSSVFPIAVYLTVILTVL